MSVSLLIPVFNHWKATAQCLLSIYKGNMPKDYEVIVIDDASSDETQPLLKAIQKQNKYPLTIIKNETNIGYLDSMNKALKSFKTDYALLLNNDVSLDKDCVKTLIDVYQRYPDIGILGATQCTPNWEELYPLKYFLRGDKATIRDHIVTSDIPKNLKDSDVIYCDDVHFACALISKNIVNEVGVYDEQFRPGNYDQEDYCLRVKELHKQVGICPKARFIHYGSVTVIDKIEQYSKALDKNRELFFAKWGEKLRKNLV